ncbi:MAG: hypothetical protein Q9191_003581 [Dirinaria sp. TL-2023a]
MGQWHTVCISAVVQWPSPGLIIASNPFGYQPWRDQRTFAAMFDILEADIVVFQETKIQRKDLSDDMVLVPGWDCYWSLPRHKKGYSGVVIYTRQSKCAPIRAEEGITGVLCPPSSSTTFADQPKEQQIGGYPTNAQMATSVVDAWTLDSEGRCVILEFPAFVLLGVYSPATRDESRDDFRLGFLNLLDARVRNLVAMGKRVILTGDLNISREPLDSANPEAAMRKNAMTVDDYISTPSRRFFNHLLQGGIVLGARDEGRERAVMWDICRGFHPARPGMFTCWEQKVNARPGNHGSRIDYVLCSLDMRAWFSDSNIQEGLMGSDHCPVYAVIKDKVVVDGAEADLLDYMNPEGMFSKGQRQRQYLTKDILPLSGKLIPEFDGRRSIRDMFTSKLSRQRSTTDEHPVTTAKPSSTSPAPDKVEMASSQPNTIATAPLSATGESSVGTAPSASTGKKRSSADTPSNKPLKRSKSASTAAAPPAPGKGQQSLKGFFKPKATTSNDASPTVIEEAATRGAESNNGGPVSPKLQPAAPILERPMDELVAELSPAIPAAATTTTSPIARSSQAGKSDAPPPSHTTTSPSAAANKSAAAAAAKTESPPIHDPIASKESWSKLFTKPVAPRCEGHDEPCITLLTKKSGINCGRSFWMCARPLGPSGAKESNTQWRCHTFIWCSDWNPASS